MYHRTLFGKPKCHLIGLSLCQDLILLLTDCSSDLYRGTQSEANRTSLNIPFHCIEVIPFHFAEKEKSCCDMCRKRGLKILRPHSNARCEVGLQSYAGKASQMEYFRHRQPSTHTITSPNIICNNN